MNKKKRPMKSKRVLQPLKRLPDSERLMVGCSDLLDDLDEMAKYHEEHSGELLSSLEAITELMKTYKGKDAEGMERNLKILEKEKHEMHQRYATSCRKALEFILSNR